MKRNTLARRLDEDRKRMRQRMRHWTSVYSVTSAKPFGPLRGKTERTSNSNLEIVSRRKTVSFNPARNAFRREIDFFGAASIRFVLNGSFTIPLFIAHVSSSFRSLISSPHPLSIFLQQFSLSFLSPISARILATFLPCVSN